jgi:hypothetical protein
MTLEQFLSIFFGFIKDVLNIGIPVFQYRITLLHMFVFYSLIRIIMYIVWNLYEPKGSEKDE